MNQQNPDQQQNRGERPRVQQQDEAIRKAQIRKAVEADSPDNPDNKLQGQEKTQFSGGT
ncbi:hypothetical protein [Nitrobacter sp.]|uniref:hypothetical protein n=1 Tax=Nitrobacter sp. TaxID=29420 RepID=UPI00399D6DD2